MLKISRHPNHEVETLRLEGRLTAPWVPEFERVALRGARNGLRLDLAGLTFADPAGVAALTRSRNTGARLENASAFLSRLLEGAHVHAPDLAERLLTRDPDADEELVRTYGGRMLATARRLLADDTAAARAVQAAFSEAFDSIERIASSDALWSHLLELTVAAALKELQREPKASVATLLPRFTRSGVRKLDLADEGYARVLPMPAPDSDAHKAQIRGSVAELPGEFRAALLLCDVEGFDVKSASRFLGLDLATTRQRLHQARQALRTLLGRALASASTAEHPLSA